MSDYDITSATMDALQEAQPRTAAGRYGLAFGRIMAKHPKADVRLVNAILREAWAEAAEPAPLDALDDPAILSAIEAAFAAPADEDWFGPAKGYYGKDVAHFIEMVKREYARLAAGDKGTAGTCGHDSRQADCPICAALGSDR